MLVMPLALLPTLVMPFVVTRKLQPAKVALDVTVQSLAEGVMRRTIVGAGRGATSRDHRGCGAAREQSDRSDQGSKLQARYGFHEVE